MYFGTDFTSRFYKVDIDGWNISAVLTLPTVGVEVLLETNGGQNILVGSKRFIYNISVATFAVVQTVDLTPYVPPAIFLTHAHMVGKVGFFTTSEYNDLHVIKVNFGRIPLST